MREHIEPWQRNATERTEAKGKAAEELGVHATSEYVPPVGPGSKSLPPSGDWRDLPPGLIPDTRNR